MPAFSLEVARSQDRDELLALLLRAFRVDNPQHPPFETLYPDLFAANDIAMGRHRIIREQGRITACVGAYPMEVRLGPCTVRTVGIGQVSCDPEARGGGRMTALLTATVDALPASGCAISWLGGRRDRYARFGWDLAGTTVQCTMDARSVGPTPDGWTVAAQVPEHAPSTELWRLRGTQPIREEVSREGWHAKLARGKSLLWTAHRRGAADEVRAFAVIREDGNNLQEWGGDLEGLHAIVAEAIARHGMARVVYQPGLDPAATWFHAHSAGESGALSNLLVIRLDATLEAFAPILRERLPHGHGVRLGMTLPGASPEWAGLGTGGDALVLDRCTMARFLFGPLAPSVLLDLPGHQRWLDQVFPLPFLLPATAHV